MNYVNKIISALSWTATLRGFFRGVNFVKIAILARLLTPHQFGIFGIITITLAFLEILTETGINPFLIAEKEIKPYINTAWIISIFRGLAISGILFLLSGPISAFFHSPNSLHLLQLAAIIPLIRGFINPSCISLIKNLQFKSEFLYRSSTVLVESVSAVLLAVLTRSPISLVLSMIISGLWEVIASFAFIRPLPKLSFTQEKITTILHHGKWVTGFGIFEFLFTNIDNIVVGRLLGSTSLGLYQNAYKVSTIPLTEINDVVYKSSFPLYSHMESNSQAKLKNIVIRMALLSSLLMSMLGMGLLLFTREIVLVLLGPTWLEIIPTVKVLALLGVFKGIAYSFNSVFMAKKKQQIVMIITLASVVGLCLTIIPLVQQYGIVGAGLSALVGSILALPVAFYFIHRELINLK